MHRVRTQPRAQAFQERRHAGPGATALLTRLPQGIAGRGVLEQATRAQLAAAHRSRQHKALQPRLEQVGELAGPVLRRRQAEHTAARRPSPMFQAQQQGRDTSLPLLQEAFERLQRRRNGVQHEGLIGQLEGRLATQVKALLGPEGLARIGTPTHQPVQRLEQHRAETLRETRARQTQRLADRVDAH